MLSLNICDIYSDDLLCFDFLNNTIDQLTHTYNTKINRIYFGSYFCSRFFCNMNVNIDKLKLFLSARSLKITLVVPVASEGDLAEVKEKIDYYLTELTEIDEITINDYGMLEYIKEKYVSKTEKRLAGNSGRLLSKDTRDIGSYSYNRLNVIPSVLTHEPVYPFNSFEVDNVAGGIMIPDDIPKEKVGIHFPFNFLTTGKICKIASIHKLSEKKLRPNDLCDISCLDHYEFYPEDDKSAIRCGRTIFYDASTAFDIDDYTGCNSIYFPLYEVLDLRFPDQIRK